MLEVGNNGHFATATPMEPPVPVFNVSEHLTSTWADDRPLADLQLTFNLRVTAGCRGVVSCATVTQFPERVFKHVTVCDREGGS